MLQEDLLPTPLLGRFALGLGSKRGSTIPEIAGEDLGFLFESFVAQADAGNRPWVVLDEVPDSNEMQGTIGVGEAPTHAAKLRVLDNGMGLWLWRHLEGAFVYTSSSVELGVQGGEFILGPDVQIRCAEFSCPVGDLFVRAQKRDEPVVLEAEVLREPSQPALRVSGDFFFVSWPRPSYPWVRHELQWTKGEDIEQQVVEAYTHLARILRRLRASGYGEVARHRDIVERFATGGTSAGKAMLQYCLKEGVIEPKGEIFVLNDSHAAAFGINWVDLGTRSVNEKVRDFLEGFVKWNQTQLAPSN